jgi:hypothetical protein
MLSGIGPNILAPPGSKLPEMNILAPFLDSFPVRHDPDDGSYSRRFENLSKSLKPFSLS